MIKEYYVIDKNILDNRINQLENLRNYIYKFPSGSKHKEKVNNELNNLFNLKKMLTPLQIDFK